MNLMFFHFEFFRTFSNANLIFLRLLRFNEASIFDIYQPFLLRNSSLYILLMSIKHAEKREKEIEDDFLKANVKNCYFAFFTEEKKLKANKLFVCFWRKKIGRRDEEARNISEVNLIQSISVFKGNQQDLVVALWRQSEHKIAFQFYFVLCSSLFFICQLQKQRMFMEFAIKPEELLQVSNIYVKMEKRKGRKGIALRWTSDEHSSFLKSFTGSKKMRERLFFNHLPITKSIQ